MSTKPKGNRLRAGRFSETNQVYLITTVVNHRRPVFKNLLPGRFLVKTLRSTQSYATTLAYVIMPDHLHWLMQLTDKSELSKVVAYVKSNSARRINQHLNQSGKFWQSGFHDHALRQEEDILPVARYLLANPLRAGIVDNIGEYPLWDAIWL